MGSIKAKPNITLQEDCFQTGHTAKESLLTTTAVCVCVRLTVCLQRLGVKSMWSSGIPLVHPYLTLSELFSFYSRDIADIFIQSIRHLATISAIGCWDSNLS